MINLLIDKYSVEINKNILDCRLLWDAFKVEVREATITYCKRKAKCSRETLRKLEKTLNEKVKLRDHLDFDYLDIEEDIKNIENDIQNIYDQKAKGAQVRAREKWVELGEKNNSYFLGLEKKRQIKKSLVKLVDEKGDIATDQTIILNMIKEYYKKLYSSTNPNDILLNDYIFQTNLESEINHENMKTCDGSLTVDEITEAIFKMKPNKSPGLDGLTVEFYRTFWQKIKHILVYILNKGHEDKCLSFSQRTSVLSLIFKKNNPLLLDNYRPISLLNVDLKLLSYTLAQRLKKILPKIINEDQTGYIKNRFIGFNLRQIQDIIDYAETYQIEGAIVFIDFSKIFDSLEWNFMLTTLKHFGFNQSFISWVETLYSNIQTCVINNGWISEIFQNTRGIRQGCPLSALLFVLSVEIMALRLRGNRSIKGIQVKLEQKTHCIKISQLADDTTLFLGSKDEISLAMNEIEIFGSFSGLILNRNKTEGIWVGKLKHCKDNIEGIKWTEEPVKVLGIYFGHDKKYCEKLNWEKKITEMKKKFEQWGKRNLSILGKILIIKALIIPMFTFLASSVIAPKEYIKEIESFCFKFIWKGKQDKVKRKTMIGKFENGGLNMLDIESYFKSLKASWVPRLVTKMSQIGKLYLLNT